MELKHEKKRHKQQYYFFTLHLSVVSMCVCVCVWERERERERERGGSYTYTARDFYIICTFWLFAVSQIQYMVRKKQRRPTAEKRRVEKEKGV